MKSSLRRFVMGVSLIVMGTLVLRPSSTNADSLEVGVQFGQSPLPSPYVGYDPDGEDDALDYKVDYQVCCPPSITAKVEVGFGIVGGLIKSLFGTGGGSSYSGGIGGYSSTPKVPPRSHPQIRVVLGHDDHMRADALRVRYRSMGMLEYEEYIELEDGCRLVIEDGVSERPDGAMRFSDCGVSGYALYYPYPEEPGQQLRVWSDDLPDPVLILHEFDGVVSVITQTSDEARAFVDTLEGDAS